MTRRFDTTYRMKDGSTKLGESFFNPVLQDIDLRLHGQEEIQKSWEGAIDVLNKYGLKRIDDYLLPTIGRVQDIVGLGFLEAKTESLTSTTLGEKSVSVVPEDRDIFTPSPFLTLTRAENIDDWAVARVIEWNPATGLLRFDVIETHGSTGPFNDLTITMMPGTVRATNVLFAKAQEITTALATIQAIIDQFANEPNDVAYIIEQIAALNTAIASKVEQSALNTTLATYLARAGGQMTGDIAMMGRKAVKFADADSTNYVALKAAENVAQNVEFTLPAQDGLPGEAMVTDGQGNLSFGSVSSGIATAMIYK